MSRPDFNTQTIADFRKNHGKVGGYFHGAPLLLLNTAGARSGRAHVVPVMYLREGDRYFVFASNGGADAHPDWYYNLKAHTDVKAEVGDDVIDFRAEEVKGPERDRTYNRQAALFPAFAGYEKKTTRKIPVVALRRKE